jgi:hypothetical protein
MGVGLRRLRSQGNDTNNAAVVNSGGNVDPNGNNVNDNCAVRPDPPWGNEESLAPETRLHAEAVRVHGRGNPAPVSTEGQQNRPDRGTNRSRRSATNAGSRRERFRDVRKGRHPPLPRRRRNSRRSP